LKTVTLHCKDLNDLKSIAQQIISFAQDSKIWLFNGEMGAGKTTLIKKIGEELMILDTVSSPTFSIVNEYLSQDETTYYHFDFYRLENEIEALDIGVEEYFYSDNVCFLEWASKIEKLLPEQYLEIAITACENGERFFELKMKNERKE